MPPSRRPRPGDRLPEPEPVRTIFLDDPSTDFCSSYNELLSLILSHPETIASRWRKKTLALRSKCLARAWSAASPGKKIPERRLRISEILLGDPNIYSRSDPCSVLSMDDFLFACINVEQLVNNPANLLNLLYSRAVKHPSNFGRSDYINFVKPVLQLFREIDEAVYSEGPGPVETAKPNRKNKRKKANVDVVVVQADESEYGIVKTWSRQSEDYKQGVIKMLVCPVDSEGTWLMKWQKTILNFCLSVVKDILGPSDLQKASPGIFGAAEKLLESVPNYSHPGGSPDSRSASLLTRPYTIPQEFNLQNAHTLALTHLRAAEDHVNLLRSDPDYLLSEVELRLAHRAEHIIDMAGRKGNPESSESVQDAVAKLIANSYCEVLVWNEICILFEDAEQLLAGKQGSWWSEGSNPVLDEKITSIDAILDFCEDFARNALALHAPSGPQLRHYFFRAETTSFTGEMELGVIPGVTCSTVYRQNPINGLLMCLCISISGWESEIFNLPRLSDEVEHKLTEFPTLKSHLHPWIMSIFSNVSAVLEIKENIARHVPSRESPAHIGVVAVVGLARVINEFGQLWPSVDMSGFLGNDQYGWQRLRKIGEAGDGLQRFWRLVDAEVVKLSKGKTLDAWISSHKGRLAKRRKGRWQWQGKVWLAERAALDEEGAATGLAEEEDSELPELVAVAGFDDSEGYGEVQPLDDTLGTENIQPGFPKPPAQKAGGQRKVLIPQPPQPVAKRKEPHPSPKPQSPPGALPIPHQREFGVNAEGSRGAESEPAPLSKEKQKTRPTASDIEVKIENLDLKPPASAEQPPIFVSKRVHVAITQLSSGIPLAWKEFVHLMVSVGFTVQAVGGSVVRFVPNGEGDEPINLHRPHPEAVLGKFECLWIWKRLKRNYGWGVEMFQRDLPGGEVKT